MHVEQFFILKSLQQIVISVECDAPEKARWEFFSAWIIKFFIQHCFIYRHSDSIVSEDARIVPWTLATMPLAARTSNHLASSHPWVRSKKI